VTAQAGRRARRGAATLVRISVLFLAVAAAEPSAAPAGWSPIASNLSPAGQDALGPDVEVGSNGAIYAVWGRRDGTTAQCCSRIQIRVRPPGEPHFGDVRNLSAAGQNAGSADVAVGPDGTVVVVWLRLDGTQPPFCCTRIQARVRPPGEHFGPVQTLSAGGHNANDPDVGVARDGRAVATWTRETPTLQRLLQARFRPATGGNSPNFGGVRTLTPGENAYSSELEVAPNGRAIVVFQRFGGATERIAAMVRPPGGEFGKHTNLSRVGDDADYPVIDMASDGSALVGWVISHQSGPETTLQARFRPPHGPFGSISRLSTSATEDYAALSVGPDRTATAVWEQSLDPDPYRLRVRTRPPGGSFGPGQFISPPEGGVQNAELATTPGGATFAAWTRSDGTSNICCNRLQARLRSPGGSAFVGQTTLSGGGFSAVNPDLAAGRGGIAAAVWQGNDGADQRIQFSRYHS
jgi:hypothetical protein